MLFVSDLVGDQELCGGNEIVKHILLFLQHAGAMPVFAKLCASAQVGDSEHAAVFQPKIAPTGKTRGEADVETSITGQQRGVLPIKLNSFLVKNKHRDS